MNRICALLSLLAAFPAIADEIPAIGLDGSPVVERPDVERKLDGSMRVHHVDRPMMALFPSATKPSRGTVLVFPGGGYVYLAYDEDGRDVAELLNGAGFDAAMVFYRVDEGDETREMALDDAKRALNLVRIRGPEFGLATNLVGAMGFSAGGHLAARLLHEAESPDFAVLIYPAYLERTGDLIDEVIPRHGPAFIYVAADDGYVRGSRVYAAYCRERGMTCEFHEAASGGHGFRVRGPLPEQVKDWPEKLRLFLRGL